VHTIDIELPDDQAARLDRFARSVSKTPREATAQLIDEGLRHAEFPAVEFRDSPLGRQAFVAGSSLAVWEAVMVAECYELNPAHTAKHLRWPPARVEQILAYARNYPDEIARALAENRAITPEHLRALLPTSLWI
jgi:hypothetical protein